MLTDPEQSLAARRRALTQLSIQISHTSGLSPVARAAVAEIVWAPRQPRSLREAAAELWMQHEPDRFWHAAARQLPGLGSAGWRRWVIREAVRQDRREMQAALASAWWANLSPRHIPTAIAETEEAAALVALSGHADLTAALVELVRDSTDPATFAAAWSLLSHVAETAVMHREAMRWRDGAGVDLAADSDLAEESVVPDAVTAGLRRCLGEASGVLGRLPQTPEGLRRLSGLVRDPIAWPNVEAGSASLPPGVAASLELRHLGLLQRAYRSQLSAPVARQEAESTDNVSPAPSLIASAMARDPAYRRGLPPAVNLEFLDPSDRALIRLICIWLCDRSVAVELFAQLDRDVADPRGEHGGLLEWDDAGRPTAAAFASQDRVGNNRRYVSSVAMMDRLARGLAHYHFHATSYDAGAFAGPGRGDLDFATTNEATSLVLTPLDRDRLNVDLVLPGDRWLDLGQIDRPTGSRR